MCISQAVHGSADLSLSLVESFLNPQNISSMLCLGPLALGCGSRL